jgi:hypothetical protein
MAEAAESATMRRHMIFCRISEAFELEVAARMRQIWVDKEIQILQAAFSLELRADSLLLG